MGKGLVGVGGDLPQDVTGSPVTEESRKNSGNFFKGNSTGKCGKTLITRNTANTIV